MKNVDFHVDESIVLHIRSLRGRLLRTKNSVPPTFDDKSSFQIEIDSGEIAIDAPGLSGLMNRYVFAYRGAPLKNIEIRTEGDKIKQKGTLHKGIDVPFEVEGSLEPTPDGQIRFHTTGIRSAHVPVKGLMELLGIKMAKLINVNESRGVRIDKNDLILYPERIIPPPHIRGKVTAIRVEQDKIVQVFGGKAEPLSPPDREAPNYMYFKGGALRFGKLTMTDADLEILDSDPQDPFDFYLDHYNTQLVAGYSKNRPNLGLTVHMPDYHRVVKKPAKEVTQSRVPGK